MDKNNDPHTTTPAENKSPNKKIIAAFISMGTVIILLTAALIVTLAVKSDNKEETSGTLSYSSDSVVQTESSSTDNTSTINTSESDSVQTNIEANGNSNNSPAPVEDNHTQQTTILTDAPEETVHQESTEIYIEPEKTDSDNSSVTESTGAQTSDTTATQTSTNKSTKQEKPVQDEPSDAKLTLVYSVDNTWENTGEHMHGVQFAVTNNTGKVINGWELIVEIKGISSCQGWNGTYIVSDNTLTITNAEYNGEIFDGGTITVGCNLGTKGQLAVKTAKLNGIPCAVTAGSIDQNAQNNNQNNQDQGNQGNHNGNNNNNTPTPDITELLERSDKAVQGDDWLYTDGCRIVDKNGKRVWLTGVNWFGYNTGTNTFDGLWNSQLKPSVEAIADHGFNLIRVPISAELINQWASGEYPKANYNNAYNPELNSMNSLQIFDYFLKLAEENGIKVMPDIHSAETNASGHNVNLWYTSKVSVNDFYHALEWMAERYKDNDTIIAYDLKNEPHGKPYEKDNAAIWNDSKDANNWKYVAETAAAKILAKNPNVLIMVEGTEIYPIDLKKNSDYHSTNEKDYYFNWWGGNLRAVRDYPIDLGKYQNKLVYSPHDYGPTVYKQPWFEGNYTFDSLMRDCWYDNWFYIHKENTAPLLIGEWGGFMREPNLTWMTYMRQLIKENKLNHTFWCFNANSGDTGGLVLDDFTTWDEEKYAFVKEVLWQENGKFVGLDHAIPLGDNGITLTKANGI